MTFQLVYYSQQDPQWKQDILGFGDPGDTIGYVGCALTSVAMLVSGYGYTETPKTLNQKLKNVNGFVSAAIRWDSVSQIYPQITMKSNISCIGNAPLDLIDSSIAAGQPVVVMVDSSPAAGLQTHWIVLYAKDGNDYLMLDPWPYQTDVTKKTDMMPRYSQGKPLAGSIMYVIIYECHTASGGIALPGGGTSTPQTQPTTTPATGAPYARVKADVTAGLNIRSTVDTSTTSNIVASVPAGTLLTLLQADGPAKVGAINQWVRVSDASGHTGFAAAWYLERVDTSASPATSTTTTTTTTSTTTSVSGSTGSTSGTSSTPAANQVTAMVQGKVGKFGLNVYASASTSSTVLNNEKARTKLIVIEDPQGAMKKIGVNGKWINVQASNGKQGFVQADKVTIP